MQSIIVYRNPLEAAFWESMSGGQLFPIMVGIVAFFAVFLLAQKLIVDRFYRWGNNGTPTNINLFASAVIAVFVCWHMLSKI